MSRKPALVATLFFLMGMLASIILLCVFLRVNAQFEEWVPYVPDASQVRLEYWDENGTSYMNISITFTSSGYNVSDWGTPAIVGNNISANAEIWKWTGADLPIVTTKSHTYNLGNLQIEEYFFIFKAWGSPVKDTTFFVPEFPLFLILLLFMISTLLAVIVYRRKHSM